jgi:undecaprenyl diphosphate synthase
MAEKGKMPEHVAIIMDGNGRWAEKHNVTKFKGHSAGMESMKEIVRYSSDNGIKYLTVYAFSTENWKRTMEEVSGIFKLLVKCVARDLAELDRENVRIRILGDYSNIPEDARKSLDKAIESTESNTGMQFNVAINYGSRAEITRAVNLLAEKVRSGDIEGEITEDMVSSMLFTGDENGNIPDPDLIIRTSGEMRLSNFLLWQAAYSEIAVTDVL